MSTQPLAIARNTSIDHSESTFVVSLDSTQGDFTSLQSAIDALPATGGKIFVKAGVYPLLNTISMKQSNIQIQGEGMGITSFVAQASMSGATPAIEALSTTSDGTARALTADTTPGDTTIRTAPTDAATFNSGDFVLLYSNKSVDTEDAAKHAGEIKQVVSVDPVTGILTLDDVIFDTYTQADSAQVVRITMLRNLTFSDFSASSLATSSQLNRGFTHFRFVENLQIERLEVHHAFFTGIHLQSARNSAISGCYVHHIRDVVSTDPPNPANARYGIVIGCASQNVTVSGCRFSHTRHAVTTGGSSGKNSNGVQRNLVISNCTSMLTDTAHFDTHQPAENVTYIGCVADGGQPAQSAALGFQMRAANSSIIGCSVLRAIGRGIMIFGPASSGAVISGNMVAGVKAIGTTEGTGIYFDAAGNSNHSVAGNVIKDCEGSAIENAGAINQLVISGNAIQNVNTVVAGPTVRLANAGSVAVNNSGYNPVGAITNPWPKTGTDLTNRVNGGTASPQSGVTYTIRQTPKTVVVSGGNISAIAVNGLTTGTTSGAFKLGVGETITIVYQSPPQTRVFAE